MLRLIMDVFGSPVKTLRNRIRNEDIKRKVDKIRENHNISLDTVRCRLVYAHQGK